MTADNITEVSGLLSGLWGQVACPETRLGLQHGERVKMSRKQIHMKNCVSNNYSGVEMGSMAGSEATADYCKVWR